MKFSSFRVAKRAAALPPRREHDKIQEIQKTMAKRWILLFLFLAGGLLVRHGWIQIDWPSIQRDLQLELPRQIQEKSKDRTVEKALPGGVSTIN